MFEYMAPDLRRRAQTAFDGQDPSVPYTVREMRAEKAVGVTRTYGEAEDGRTIRGYVRADEWHRAGP